jgi:GDPmannose 4,6-dehydratase
MWQTLQQETPGDYVVATGESHSVRDLLDEAFSHAGLDWHDYVVVDPRYFRPAEVDHLRGDPGLARERLGWQPRVTFQELVRMIVEHDLELARQEQTLKDAGHIVVLRGIANG